MDKHKNNLTDIENMSYDEIIANLADENCHDFIKIFSIIELDSLLNKSHADFLIKHLTNRSTPLREAAAYKIEQLAKNYPDFFNDDFTKKSLLKAISDINPNVSRYICSVISNKPFNSLLTEDIIFEIQKILKSIKEEEKTSSTKSHAKNKKIFALYWYLEALCRCRAQKDNSQVLEILKSTINFNDYTIREKTAKIVALWGFESKDLKEKIKSDENFYVKNQVYDKINFVN